jgi:hypothetical protein
MATPTPTTDTTPTVDPMTQALNVARDTAVKTGQDPYAGSLKSLGSFTQPLPSATPAPISASALQTPQTPYAVPPPNNTPTTGNLALSTNSTAAQAQADASYVPPNPAKDALNKSLQDIVSSINGQAGVEDKLRQDNQIYQKKQKATALSTEMDQLDKSYRDQVQQIQKENPNGIGSEVQTQKIAQAQDRYENNRANLALTYKVAAEDYNGALQIVNDKIASLDKQHSQQLSAYQLAVAAVNNDLTDSEKLKVQANLQKQQEDQKAVRDAYSTALKTAVQNGAPASVLAAIDEALRVPNATASQIYTAAGSYAINPADALDMTYKQAQIDKIYSDISGAGQDPTEVLAYAQQYASTGQIPTGMPKGMFGTVAQAAKELPKQDGAIVDAATGVVPHNVSPADLTAYGNIHSVIKKLDELGTAYSNTSLLSNNQQRQIYKDVSAEIVDLIGRDRSGAVLNDQEIAQYQAKVPRLFGLDNLFGANLPATGAQKIQDLKHSLTGILQSKLDAHGAVMYGVTPVKLGDHEYKVGDTVTNEQGQTGTVNPDGTISVHGEQSYSGEQSNLSLNRPQRNNNPLNIKASSFTQSFPGVAGLDPKPAADGGKFLTFNSPEAGFNAAKKLITSANYANLSVDAALKRWSNNGYGGNLVPSLAGKKVSQLTPSELDTVIKSMAQREGYTA